MSITYDILMEKILSEQVPEVKQQAPVQEKIEPTKVEAQVKDESNQNVNQEIEVKQDEESKKRNNETDVNEGKMKKIKNQKDKNKHKSDKNKNKKEILKKGGENLDKEFKDISVILPNEDKKSGDSSSDEELNKYINNMNEIQAEQIKLKNNKLDENNEKFEKKIEKMSIGNVEENFIPLKDDPKFKNESDIEDIKKDLKEITQYQDKEGIINKTKFIEIKHDDMIDFKDEYNLNFFKEINFILSEDSKRRLNLLYFCIKHGFHILIPGPTGTGKTYLSEAICNLLNKKMIKINLLELNILEENY